MKKLIALLLAFVMMTVLGACAATAEEPVATVAEKEGTTFAIIAAKNCFYDAGYVELIAGAEATAEYIFTAENSEAVEWQVYVLDEAFDDGFRYIAQFTDPVLIGDGTITVNAGQYVYLYCSANEFTTGVVDENAKIVITVK